MSLRLGGHPGRRISLAAIRRRLMSSQVGGYGPDLRVRVVAQARGVARTTTPGPDAEHDGLGETWEGPRSSSHPEARRRGGTDGGPSLRVPGFREP